MKAIGFSTKFYTLWEVSVDTFTNVFGRKGRNVTSTFIKNISMDEQTARNRYPGVPVDLSLRGHSSFHRVEWEPLASDVFPCGKYAGQPIAECTDFPYLYWAVDSNMLHDESRDIAVSVLLKSGRYGEYDGVVMPMERVNELLEEDATHDEIASIIDFGGCLDIMSLSNIRKMDEGVFVSNTDVNGVKLVWDRSVIKDFYYNGIEYFLPVKDGKAKRIKGKKLHIVANRYAFNGHSLEVSVNDFEIVK